MELDTLQFELLWQYYQQGYHSLTRSGLYFRQVLRPALSHVYFQRAMPLLVEYARANRLKGNLPPGFGDQMEACPLTPRDLLHLDYAICLGYAEARGIDPALLSLSPMLDWPGPGGSNGIFIAADAPAGTSLLMSEEIADSLDDVYRDDDPFDSDDDDEDDDPKPPFDL